MDGKKILIIEDEAIIAMNTRSILEMKGYAVVGIAIEGSEAVELALKYRPDLMLVDIMLSGDIDGISAVEKIRQTLDIPVVYMTAHSNDTIFNRAKATNPYGYLIKPVSQNDIHSAIDLALYKHDMESRLKQSETRYRSLFENSMNAIAIYQAVDNGDDFIFLDFNKSAEKADNARRDEIVGRSVREVFPGVTEFGLFDVFREVWKTGISRYHPVSLYKDERIQGWRENLVFKLTTGEIVAVYRDETERKKAEESLRENEERFRSIINNSPLGYFFIDRDRCFKQVNEAFVKMHKYDSADELIGKHVDIIYQQEDRQTAKEISSSMFLGQTIPIGEFARKCKDGSRGHGIFSASPVRKGGEIIGVEGFIIDITEKKNIETALAISNQLNKEIISNAKIGIVVYDRHLNIILWNRFMEDLTDCTAEQVLGKSVVDSFPHIKEQGIDRILKDALAGTTIYARDLPFHVPASGKSGWVRSTYSPHYNARNEIIGVIELTNDITEIKRAGNALLESEKKYRELVENANSIILRRNIQGEITFINEFAQRFFGYGENEILGKNVVGTIVPEYESSGRDLRKMIHDISHNPERYATNENENTLKNGERVWIAWTNKAVKDENGTVREILCIGNDITQRMMAEKKIKESLLEKDILIKEIHHRVKNNMQIISSLLSLQSMYIRDTKDLELFRDCHNRVRSMALVHEMLYQSNDLVNIDFRIYIKQIAKQLFIAWDRNPESIQFEVDASDVHLNINTAIPCALIINEVLSNSLKYAFPGGRPGRISVSFKKNTRGKYTMEISDNGVGLPDDFDLNDTKTLGIQLVNELVKQLRGTIRLNKKAGTRFTIIFSI